MEKDPDLAGIFAFQRKRWAAPHRWPEIAASLRAMRRQRFDLAIDLQGLARSSMFAWLANAGLTVGLDNLREGCREGARAMYDLTPPRASPQTHAVDRYLAVLPLLGVPVHWDFEWLPRPARKPPGACATNGGRSGRDALDRSAARRTVGQQTLAGGVFRRPCPSDCSDIPDLSFVVLGSKDERPLGETIAAAAPGRAV